ncbi:ribonuclease P protein component [Glaciibacter sp. 2TAF33]|uniref:ribonuclease P protein component n=1 Tax=Glaciibacter sp. 2TAF33 TaxID=3233015 RepID=UPI003F903D68
MLAKTNRITSGSDYKAVVRRGFRVVGPHTVMYLRSSQAAAPVRFGFIVAKNVGGAVTRNRIRRRMKAASYELVLSVEPGTDVVIRALPASARAEWSTLQAEISASLSRGLSGAGRTRK